MYKIGIIGLGYVGLPLAHAFSEKFKVIGFDINDHLDRPQETGNHLGNGVMFTSLPITFAFKFDWYHRLAYGTYSLHGRNLTQS